jgi:hypothetical protein
MTDTTAWASFEYFVGAWQGRGEGKSGVSRVERTYQFALDGTFLFAQSKSIYAPTEKSPGGEVHQDWGLFSYDSARKTHVLRQFHVEGFVNQYILESFEVDGKIIRFVTEAIENIPPGWNARETYRILSADEFVEVFELAAPGKEFEL